MPNEQGSDVFPEYICASDVSPCTVVLVPSVVRLKDAQSDSKQSINPTLLSDECMHIMIVVRE